MSKLVKRQSTYDTIGERAALTKLLVLWLV